MARRTTDFSPPAGGACVAATLGVVLLSALLLGTVLTGPAAPQARPELADPFAAQVPGPAEARADLVDPFATAPTHGAKTASPSAAPVAAPAPGQRRAKRRVGASADLRDPFSPDSEGEAAARRPSPTPRTVDLAGPFTGPTRGEAAAKRVVPLATAEADLRDPFAR